ncbi:MAG: hydrogenase nickel incorporation protein HypB [Bacilli bacterium]|nr:hydrogenase nickel incorporation protein HypB [Bacilli bacterium]
MDKYKIIQIKENILARNDNSANELRKELKEKKCYLLNVMSSPGSGKTTLLVNLINKLKDRLRIGVMEADIDSDVDASTIVEKTGVQAIQVHTGGACHLTAQMTRDAMNEWGIDNLDLIILENVGNLVCPAEFDTGSIKNLMILSVPEGDDKPLKYPLMFEVSSIAVISKIDTMSVFDFSMEKVEERIHMRNPNTVIFPVSAKKDIGVDKLADYLYKEVAEFIK